MENVRHLTSINRVHQHCSVPLNVLNDLDYEDSFPIRPHRLYNVEQTSIINMSTPQSTIFPLSSSFNYAVEYNTSNATSFSRSPLDDPPPSYDECIVNSRSTPRFIH